MSRDINELLPVMQRAAREFLRRCAQSGLKVQIIETYRSPERQRQLYAQGRTVPGRVVTRTTTSPHMYRIAFDFIRADGRDGWDDSDGFFGKCGKIWRDMGGVWGGDWPNFVDKPHCEYTAGLHYSWFALGNTLHDDIRMRWEVPPLVEKIRIKVVEDGKANVFTVGRIFVSLGTNYIAARTLGEILGYRVSLDTDGKTPVFEKIIG